MYHIDCTQRAMITCRIMKKEEMTLRHLCEKTGVSRRAIQGFEKAGLIEPVAKTKSGYLIYDETSNERVLLIKFFQRARFKVIEDVYRLINKL